MGTDYRTQFDKETLAAWDLQGREVTVKIIRWKREKVGGHSGKKASNKIWLWFEGKTKPMVCNVTNAGIIAGMYGKIVEEWIGQRITIFPTTTQFGKDTVDCIRVKPRIPGAKTPDAPPDPPPAEDDQPASEGAADEAA